MHDGTSVLIVEDDSFLAMELADTLRSLGCAVIGPFASVAAALAIVDGTPVTAAILDVHLLDRDVTPLAVALIDRRVPLVVYSGSGLPEALHSLKEFLPVVPKDSPPEAAVALLLSKVPLPSSTDRAHSGGSAASDYTSLTRNQIGCLRLFLQGKSSRQIGGELGLPASIVNDVLRSACTRLGVGTRLEAAMAAVHLGLIEV